MQDLLPLLQPTIDKFLESLETLYKEAENSLKQAQDERLEVERDREALKQEGLNNAELRRKELFSLKEKQEKLDATYKELSDKILEKNRLNKEIRTKLDKIESNLKETEELKVQASQELEKKRQAREVYEKKTKILQEDTDRLSARSGSLNDRENKVTKREKTADKKDEEIAAKTYELSQKELKNKENERRIKAEWGRIDAAKHK